MIGNNNKEKITAYTRILATSMNGYKSESTNIAKKDANLVTLIATYEPDSQWPDRFGQITFSISRENGNKESLDKAYLGVSFYIQGSTIPCQTNCFNPYVANSLPKGKIDKSRDVFLLVEYR